MTARTRCTSSFKMHHYFCSCLILFLSCIQCQCMFTQKLHLKAKSRSDYRYKTSFFTQQVDHFGFNNKDTFQQKYLVADQYWSKNNGPIFFYTGNEKEIEFFCNNTGFMWDIAPEFKAMIVFAEHRYYGKSIPYGQDVFKDLTKIKYLTTEQVLEDYAILIKHIKSTTESLSKAPVIAFGGSYGGMLAAWLRMKYPEIVIGSLAASASIWQFADLTACNAYNRIVTRTFKLSSPQCVDNIRKSWSTIDTIGSTTSGKVFITDTFRLCSPLTTSSDVENFKFWLADMYGHLAMVDYPYPSSFIQPLPEWPVKAVCEHLSQPGTGKALIEKLYQAANLYFNYTGNIKCLKTSEESVSLDHLGWDYQACTEMVLPMCSNGQTDMFEPSPWNFQQYSDGCFKRWKVRPREYWIEEQYGGKNIKYASNIIFSNGDLDPWSGGGVLHSLSDSLIAIKIADAAHHLDLRAVNSKDTKSLKAARQQELNIFRDWLNHYHCREQNC